MSFIQFKAGNGFTYALPVLAVARHKAFSMLDQKDAQDPAKAEAAMAEVSKEFEAVPLEAVEWAKGNMDWNDVRPFALPVDFEVIDMQREWVGADMEIVDHCRPMTTEKANTILNEMGREVLATMEARRLPALNAEFRAQGDQTPVAAISVVFGPETVKMHYRGIELVNAEAAVARAAIEKAAEGDEPDGEQAPTPAAANEEAPQ